MVIVKYILITKKRHMKRAEKDPRLFQVFCNVSTGGDNQPSGGFTEDFGDKKRSWRRHTLRKDDFEGGKVDSYSIPSNYKPTSRIQHDIHDQKSHVHLYQTRDQKSSM